MSLRQKPMILKVKTVKKKIPQNGKKLGDQTREVREEWGLILGTGNQITPYYGFLMDSPTESAFKFL